MKYLFALITVLFIAGCGSDREMEGAANADVTPIMADVETSPVQSEEDAADDPAIWINHAAPQNSLVIGTDKKAGLYVYDLQGGIVSFAPLGNENNVDLRQNLTGAAFGGHDTLIASSNRTTETVDILTLTDDRELELLGSYPTGTEPYGLCVGLPGDKQALRVLLNYKNGRVELTDVTFNNGQMNTVRYADLELPGQLEGCTFDETAQEMFIGQENGGVWRYPMQDPVGKGQMQAAIGVETGLVEDVEGLDIYHAADGRKILVASSQGDFTYVAFEILPDRLKPLKKFRIADNAEKGVDGVQETDGLAMTSVALGPDFPSGILVVQDGENEGGFQNFKIVDWRRVEDILNN